MYEIVNRGSANINFDVVRIDRFEYLFFTRFRVMEMNLAHSQVMYLIRRELLYWVAGYRHYVFLSPEIETTRSIGMASRTFLIYQE